MLEELILKLARERKIYLVQTNHATKMIRPKNQSPKNSFCDQIGKLIQFETFKPAMIWFQSKKRFARNNLPDRKNQEKSEQIEDENEGWTLVTRPKKLKKNPIYKESRLLSQINETNYKLMKFGLK